MTPIPILSQYELASLDPVLTTLMLPYTMLPRVKHFSCPPQLMGPSICSGTMARLGKKLHRIQWTANAAGCRSNARYYTFNQRRTQHSSDGPKYIGPVSGFQPGPAAGAPPHHLLRVTEPERNPEVEPGERHHSRRSPRFNTPSPECSLPSSSAIPWYQNFLTTAATHHTRYHIAGHCTTGIDVLGPPRFVLLRASVRLSPSSESLKLFHCWVEIRGVPVSWPTGYAYYRRPKRKCRVLVYHLASNGSCVAISQVEREQKYTPPWQVQRKMLKIRYLEGEK
ncbi:hypothetical protein EDB92DRAFT_2100609 [Lactarius akahatsu]|uniref:Uncharacterized protein n=1 Tax=Lactarius akahatsu TaxID=416441 RepID=A0AAD4QCB6_9AGAM|nr:hypothetical protein EDB92DRAFT_2108070 [Lactarius akahatsu]KAH8999782.1 hypothetical protein EDB92DRAFT_2100609 [Lactarius akahatsu]